MKQYIIRPGLLDRRRKLSLAPDLIEWEAGDLKGYEFTRMNRSDIIDFKHGMDPVTWYKFTVGRQFSITLKDRHNGHLKIQFSSYSPFHQGAFEKYVAFIDDLWKLYYTAIVNNTLDDFYNSRTIEVQGIKLATGGVELRQGKDQIPWERVAVKKYYRYFAIYDRDNANYNTTIKYNEFGTEKLWSVLTTILKAKQTTA